MTNLLEINHSHISKLSDSDLRDLIGRLCEAGFRNNSLLLEGIQYGGHQNAPDGGSGVHVES